MNPSYDYDVIVVGTGPGGCSAALEAASMGKRVAVVEQKGCIGGVSIHKGTITSKLLRQSVLSLSNTHQSLMTPLSPSLPTPKLDMAHLLSQVETVISTDSEAVTWKLGRSGVPIIFGQATFVDPHTMIVTSDFDTKHITGEAFILSPGSSPFRPPSIPFDGHSVLDSNDILFLKSIPQSLIVVGGGVIGLEYANMFAALGVETTLIDRDSELLDFVDREIMEILCQSLSALGITFRLGAVVDSVSKEDDHHVTAHLAGGENVSSEGILFCVGRYGNTKKLKLDKAGIHVDERGLIPHDGSFRTSAPHIFAVGDVVGFPALSSTAMVQGRIAARVLFENKANLKFPHVPHALFTIPEISMIGCTESDVTSQKIPYEVGRARFYDTTTGHILQESQGMIKLVFRPDTLEILGVHIIGSAAAEIIHIGQAVMELGGTLEYFKETVMNYPTLAGFYRQAALDGLKISGRE